MSSKCRKEHNQDLHWQNIHRCLGEYFKFQPKKKRQILAVFLCRTSREIARLAFRARIEYYVVLKATTLPTI